MKNPARHILRIAPVIFALAALATAVAMAATWFGELGNLQATALVVLPLAAAFAVALRRMHNEDRIARLEAALCRERGARTQADQALAEADLLLARLASGSRSRGGDPVVQVTAIHADLALIQRQVAREQPQLGRRLEQLCRRLERAGTCLRNLPRAAEPG